MADTNVKVLIEAILKDEGFRKAVTSVENIDRSLRKTETKLATFENAAKKVGQALSGAFAAGTVGKFATDAILEFAKIERGFNALGVVLGNLGMEVPNNLDAAKRALYDLARNGGAQVEESLPVLQKFVGITRSMAAALEATRLASNIAESGLMDAGAAAEAVANIMQGEAKDAAKRLGIELVDLNGHVKSNRDILAEVIGQYGDLGEKIDDTTTKLSKWKAGWRELKDTVAEFLVTALLPVASLLDKLGSTIGAFAVGISKTLANAVTLDFAGAEAAYARYMDRIDEIWGQGGEDAQTAFWERAWAQAKLLEQTDRKAAEDRRQKEIEDEKRHAEEIAKVKLDAQKKMWAELDAVVAQIRAQQEAEFAALEEEIAKLAAKAEEDAEARARLAGEVADAILRTAADTAETEEERRAAELAIMEADYEQRIAYAHSIGADTAGITEEYERRKNATLKRWAQADVDIERAKALQKQSIALQSAQIAIGALQSLFGENKALSVASAIISTWEGANKALAMGPVGIPLAAAIVAAGLANVAKIVSTDPGGDATKGSGFDNPRNDRTAYLGGIRWANDFTEMVGMGLRDGLAGASLASGGVVTNNSNTVSGDTYNVSISGTVIDDRAIRMLDRKLNVARRRDQGRFIR